jgi:hypothetical protein
MLFVRFFMLVTWPIRLPFMLLGRVLRGGARGARGANRAAEAAVAGGASKVARKADHYDKRFSGIWQVFAREANDETIIRPDQDELAAEWAQKALRYFSHRPELFPARDFYEEVERDYFISEVARIETDGESEEDQFVRLVRQAREIANTNARTLFCELAPLALLMMLVLHASVMLFDPLGILTAAREAVVLEGPWGHGAAGIAMGALVLGAGLLFIAFIYRFSFTHIQRQNAQELNSFIQSEFTSLNQSFNVARAECMQAETRFDSTQHDKVEPRASAWALAYHWIGVRQFAEEMCIRNNMFQIRRNTWLYKALGFILCVVFATLVTVAVAWAASSLRVATPLLIVCAHMIVLALAFVVVCYALIMREPFSLFASRLPKDEWSRFDKLRIGEAIAEQVGRDKKQIVIQRDRRGG